MTPTDKTPDLDELRRLLERATPGPWEDDHEKNEGSYGTGWNVHEGYNSAVILSPDGKRLFDALNSDAAYIHEDRGADEHGAYCSAWDETSIRNAELIVAAVNALPALLSDLQAVREENEQLRLAMLGGEDAPGYAASLPLATVLHSFADYLATVSIRAQSAEQRAEKAEAERDGYRWHLSQCEQIAGKALGYPWFKDDQKNFPSATEAEGVCIGEHVGDSIVEELASRFSAIKAERDGLREALVELRQDVAATHEANAARIRELKDGLKALVELRGPTDIPPNSDWSRARALLSQGEAHD